VALAEIRGVVLEGFYASVTEARAGIAGYFRFYNHERLHQSLDYRTRRRSTWHEGNRDDRTNFKEGSVARLGDSVPNPWDLSLSRQNVCSTMKALERRIGLRRDATRAPIQGPEWPGGGLP